MTTLQGERKRYQVPVYRFDTLDAPEEPQRAAADADEAITVRYEERQYGDPDLSVVYERGGDWDRDRYRFRVVDEERRWCRSQAEAPSELPVAVRHAVTAFGFGIIRDRPADNSFFAWLEAIASFDALVAVEAEYEAYPVVCQAIQDALGALQTLIDILRAKVLLPASTFRRVWERVEPPTPDEYRAGIDTLNATLAATVEEATVPAVLDRDELHVIIDSQEISTVDGAFLLVDMITELDAHRFQLRLTGDDRCVLQQPGGATVPPPVVKGVQGAGLTVENVATVRQAATPLAVAEHAAVFTNQLWGCSLVHGRWQDRLTNPIEVAFVNAGVAALALKVFDLDADLAHEIHTFVCDRHGITSVEQLDTARFEHLFETVTAHLPPEVTQELASYVETHPSQGTPRRDATPDASS